MRLQGFYEPLRKTSGNQIICFLHICLDKNNVYQFGGKRQSADREIRKRILAIDETIRCDEYTASQFEEDERNRLTIEVSNHIILKCRKASIIASSFSLGRIYPIIFIIQ